MDTSTRQAVISLPASGSANSGYELRPYIPVKRGRKLSLVFNIGIAGHRALAVPDEAAERVLQTQNAYHERSARWQEIMARRLEAVAMVFFVLGVFLILARAIAYHHWPNYALPLVDPKWGQRDWIRYWFCYWIKVFSILFPTLGALFAGIRGQGAFTRLAARSRTMSDFLRKMRNRLTASPPRERWKDSVRYTTAIAEEMLGEVTAWRTVINEKGLSVS